MGLASRVGNWKVSQVKVSTWESSPTNKKSADSW